MEYTRNGNFGLPLSGVMADGKVVSNYNLLPHAVLLSEGWALVEEPVHENVVSPPSTDEVLADLIQLLVDKEVIF